MMFQESIGWDAPNFGDLENLKDENKESKETGVGRS